MIIEVELVGFISLLAFHFSFSRANCLSIDDSDVVLFSLLPLKCCILLCLCCNMSLFPNSLSLFFLLCFCLDGAWELHFIPLFSPYRIICAMFFTFCRYTMLWMQTLLSLSLLVVIIALTFSAPLY